MAQRAVTKQLAGVEDLLLGVGTDTQLRQSGDVPVTKINASNLPYDASRTIRGKLGRKPEILNNLTELQTWPTNTEEDQYIELLGLGNIGDGLGGLLWLDTTDTTSVQDFSLIFNPDDLANGRWKRVDTSEQITPDHGDQDVAIAIRSAGKHLFATTLTANRVVSLPTTNLYKGLTKRVIRTDTGAFTLAIGSVATIPSGGKYWVEVTWTGSVWVQSAAGALL